MKCDKCGYIAREGDQRCVNCGATLRLSDNGGNSLKQVKFKGTKKQRIINVLIMFLVIASLTIISYFVYQFIKGQL